MAKDFIKNTWYIYGKGYSNCMSQDYATGHDFADIEYRSGYILFTGTEGQLDDYLLTFKDDEFKVRGVFVYKSTEYYMWKYGPDYDAKKDANNKPIGENCDIL